MGFPNYGRLADLGHLPKNFIRNKLWQHNMGKLKEQLKEKDERIKELEAQLEKYQVPGNQFEENLKRNPLKNNSDSDEGFVTVS